MESGKHSTHLPDMKLDIRIKTLGIIYTSFERDPELDTNETHSKTDQTQCEADYLLK